MVKKFYVTHGLLCFLQVRPKLSWPKQKQKQRLSVCCQMLWLSRWRQAFVSFRDNNQRCWRFFSSLWSFLLCVVQNGNAAASLSVAEQYVSAFSKLAKESNTILLPSNSGDISGMVTQVFLSWTYMWLVPDKVYVLLLLSSFLTVMVA